VGRHKSKPADTDAASVLGKRVRQLRTARGLTLKQLGAATGLSHGFLSQVERDRARPSMATLGDIAGALGVSAGALLSQTTNGTARHVRRAEASLVDNNGVMVRALTGRDALMKVMESAGSFERLERTGHPGEEVVYVIEGQVEIEVGDETFLLGAGDVLNFDSSLAHAYQTVGDAQPRVLVITADPGQYASPVDGTLYE
jgi:transcriptional regulator with XRE-family HTH domain